MESLFAFFLALVLIVMNTGYVIVPMVRQRIITTGRAVALTGLMLFTALVMFIAAYFLHSLIPAVLLVIALGAAHVAGLSRLWRKPKQKIEQQTADATPIESSEVWTQDHFQELLQKAESVSTDKINIGQALRNGREFHERGNDDAAVVNYLMAIKSRRENPYPYVHVGRICKDKGLPREAKKYLEIALRNSGGLTNDARRNTFDAEVLALLREVRGK